MTDLETVVQRSLAQAAPHSKKVYGQNPLTALEIIELANSRVLTVAATVKPNGRSHLSPSDLVSLTGILYIGVDEATARFKNLKHNPAIALMIADGWKRQAILEGRVKFLDMKSATAKSVLEVQKKKYGWVTDALAEFIPEKAFTYKSK